MLGLVSVKQNSLVILNCNSLIEAERGQVACWGTHSMFVNAERGLEPRPVASLLCACSTVIICDTVFNCYLSPGTSLSPRSPWKKVQCCSLISLATFHLFQMLMALPIMQCPKQTLGYLPGPLLSPRVQKMVSPSFPKGECSF